jgi:hypothetical protein
MHESDEGPEWLEAAWQASEHAPVVQVFLGSDKVRRIGVALPSTPLTTGNAGQATRMFAFLDQHGKLVLSLEVPRQFQKVIAAVRGGTTPALAVD